ncbi:hypothetical protein CRG98_025350, partial [Punica granatum]
IFDWRSPTSRSSREHNRVPRPLAARTKPPTTCHFTPRLRRVVPSRSKGSSQPSPSSVKRWSRSEGRPTVHNLRFVRFSLTGFLAFLPNFLSRFRVCSGLGTFGSAYGHLDSPLRSPTSPTLHLAVPGACVPAHSPETAAAVLPLGSPTHSFQSESRDSHGRVPDSFPLATRLGNIPLQLREARILDSCLHETFI